MDNEECFTSSPLKCSLPPDTDGSGNGISLSLFFNASCVNIEFSAETVQANRLHVHKSSK